jgi:hypothetical protein
MPTIGPWPQQRVLVIGARWVAPMLLSAVATLAGACASSKPATFAVGTPGPDVVNFTLPGAENHLQSAGVKYQEYPVDHQMFGIIVRSDWLVCSETKLGPNLVRLNVSNDQCTDVGNGS